MSTFTSQAIVPPLSFEEEYLSLQRKHKTGKAAVYDKKGRYICKAETADARALVNAFNQVTIRPLDSYDRLVAAMKDIEEKTIDADSRQTAMLALISVGK